MVRNEAGKKILFKYYKDTPYICITYPNVCGRTSISPRAKFSNPFGVPMSFLKASLNVEPSK